jgi:hypothetical protein
MTLAHGATEKPLVMTHSSHVHAARARADEIDAEIRARARAVATGDLKVVGESKYSEDVDYIQDPQTGLLHGSHGHGGGGVSGGRNPAAVEAAVKVGVAMGTAAAQQQGVKPLAGSNGHPKIVSSAQVSAKKANKKHPVVVNSNKTFTQPTMPAMRGHSQVEHAAYDKTMNLFTRQDFYPNMRPAQLAGTSDEIAAAVIAHMKENILFLYGKANDKQKEALIWYVGARSRVDGLVTKYGVSDATATGVLAVLSPRTDWDVNVYVAEKLVEIMSTKQSHGWDKKMETKRLELIKKPTLAKYKNSLAAIKGKSLGELTSPLDKAAWIRIYDEAHSAVEQGGRMILPFKDIKHINADGSLGHTVTTQKKGQNATASWGKMATLARAVEVFDAKGDREKISKLLGNKHKVRSFYNDILDPFSTNKDVVADVHAIGAAWLAPLSDNEAPYPHAMATSPATIPGDWIGAPKSAYTGISGTYPLYVEAYRQAAADAGVMPHQMQAVVWTVKRDVFGDGLKDEAAGKIRAMWDAYRDDPAMKIEDVQKQIWDYANGDGRVKH